MLARYEFKYLVGPETVARIREVAAMYVEPDRFGDNGAYTVSSLYLDSSDWMLARQTLVGQRNRFKLRLRTYGFSATDLVFAENKGRVGSSIVKSRALMSRAQASALARADVPPAGGFTTEKPRDQSSLDRFRALQDGITARPALWVQYYREAYQSVFGDGARLTFDTRLQVQIPSTSRPFEPDAERWARVPLRRAHGGVPAGQAEPVILELKFNNAFPAWMDRMARTLRLQRVSCSKYLLGAQLLGEQPFANAGRSFSWMA